MLPLTIFDKHSLRVLFHFARSSPSARPDVLVVIISMLSSAPVPITNIRFQAAVPKVPPAYTFLCFILYGGFIVCVVADNESETPATIRIRFTCLQSVTAPCCHYTSSSVSQPSQGKQKLYGKISSSSFVKLLIFILIIWF